MPRLLYVEKSARHPSIRRYNPPKGHAMNNLVKYRILLSETLLKPARDFWVGLSWYREFPNARVSFDIPHFKSLHVDIGDGANSYMIKVYGTNTGNFNISIGARTQIARDVVFIISKGHEKGNPSKESEVHKGFIAIGKDVWIGHGAIIMPNITISDGATIGASAVVTHNVMPFQVVVGVPAHPIRKKG
jgi:acetyltransferase-like isoleucine patch superfamily enzyme